MLVLQEMHPEEPGLILGHSSLAANNVTIQKNGINREHSRKTKQTVLSRKTKQTAFSRYNILKKFRKTESLVTSEIRAQRVRQQSRKLQRKRAL